ncbi:ribbon-helix-helix protein, CopG family [Candidatus Woesearchaeota archaeon]|nr:ribbon-helix-helix protein, CopG family [Candidatus Woesearchaeota archaeon]
MKRKISVTVEESTVLKLFEAISKTRYKNRSEIIEESLKKFLEEEQR